MSPLRTPLFEGPVEPDGELRCMGRMYLTDPRCPETAVWHVAWKLAPRGHFSLVCAQHMAGSAKVYDYVDRHPAETTCTMPGVGWLTRTGQTSRCVILVSEDPDDSTPRTEG
ncbi:hypothetical protein [Streptomyces sp. NPDC094468]|uniref:hypothetical protein n=1 Tax=Streptomyces sp. NPDC094468 TaxID=3366066 RepID=UPI0038108015